MVSPKVFVFKTDYQCKKVCAERKKKVRYYSFDNWLFFLDCFFLSLAFSIFLLCVKKKIRQRNLNCKNNYIMI